MKALAIIPARSGSKGLPGKNIKPIKGVPLMGYTIAAAKNSGCFDQVLVSTDSREYADIALKLGAQVPFLRSDAMASDTASSWDTAREVLKNYKDMGETFDVVALLQPTSPLRTAKDIDGAMELMVKKDADAVVSVCLAEHSPLLCNTLGENMSLDGFLNKEAMKRRQDQGEFYRINGAIYLVKTSLLQGGGEIYGPRSYAYIMDKTHSIDIDDEMDFDFASYFFFLKKKKK